MGSLVSQQGCCVLLWVLFFTFICRVKANVITVKGTVSINGSSPIAHTDENFICATLDWWPPDKCDFGNCSWGNSSLLNLDLKNNILLNAVKAFSPLKMRLGGTLQDKVIYQTEGDQRPCTPFVNSSSELFGFTQGCLPLTRWDELNWFFNKSGAVFIFGLNALNGKSTHPNRTATGPWNSTNAESLIRYTVKRGYNNLYGWELGNELGGMAIGVGVAANTYASDTIVFQNLIRDIYKGVHVKPQIIAPGSLFDAEWFKEYIAKTAGSLNVVTFHTYILGGGNNNNLIDRILNPSFLDNGTAVFKNLQSILKRSRTSAVAWLGESGGAFNSGRDKVTNAFVSSFWYVDHLGLASMYDTKTYCRQTLIGGNYGLLDTKTFIPNPDYYSALLWHRLMGRSVLSTTFKGTRMIRAYSHCAKQSQGINLLLINLDNKTTVQAQVNISGKQFSATTREEYHLTPMGGDIQSQNVLLNGKALTVDSSGTIPPLKPVIVSSSKPIKVDPYSIVFVHLPNVSIPACR